MAINLFNAENPEGAIDVARALGSTATAMYVYDLPPGRSSSPITSNKISIWPGDEVDELVFRRDTALPWSDGEEGWDTAG